jgi:hypothetical protein
MKEVCYFHNPKVTGSFHGYEISTLDPAPYFLQGVPHNRRRHARGRLSQLLTAGGVDSLYRECDPSYTRFAGDFVDKYRAADLVILATYNPIHPEILRTALQRPKKILGFIDDPHSSYVRGIPYLWAFDGAFYISPGYNANHNFADALNSWGCEQSHWFPLVTTPQPHFDPTEEFFVNRDLDVIYIGGSYGSKTTRLAQLKRRLGPRLLVHGRWPYRGYVGWLRGLQGKPIFPHRVTPIPDQARRDLYLRTKIGINLHLSDVPSETGNARMYEVPRHGAMLLCDKAALGMHERIFRPDVEAVYYDSLEDALQKVEYFCNHPAERIAIARAGYERVERDYGFEEILKGLLDWASGIPTGTSAGSEPA